MGQGPKCGRRLTYITDKSLAVVGFVIEIGFNIDPLLFEVLSRVDSIPSTGDQTYVGPLTFGALASTLASNPVYR
jgi:hypothetical protein